MASEYFFIGTEDTYEAVEPTANGETREWSVDVDRRFNGSRLLAETDDGSLRGIYLVSLRVANIEQFCAAGAVPLDCFSGAAFPTRLSLMAAEKGHRLFVGLTIERRVNLRLSIGDE